MGNILSSIGRVYRYIFRKNEAVAANLAVIRCAPVYDSITEITSDWLAGLAPRPDAQEFLLAGPDVTRAQLVEVLNQTSGVRRVKIFFGHGNSDALLGPPQGDSDDTIVSGSRHSRIYDLDMINSCKSSLFAFCCLSGSKLGKEFCVSSDRTFLGFNDEILLDVTDAESADTWRRISQTVTKAIIASGEVRPEHEDMLLRLYDTELLYYADKARRDSDQGLFMMMYLLDQRSKVCCY